jgi:hypothetical protein
VLKGYLADGAPFDFALNSTNSIFTLTDYFNTGATLKVTLFTGIPGDYNNNGIVDDADYIVWQDALGTTVATRGLGGDGNFDGQVTEADYYVWQLHYGESFVVASPIGDYNGDGTVNAGDYTIWRNNLGRRRQGLAADGDHNGVVDREDFNIWKTHYGQSNGQGGSVPEPAAAMLGLLAACLMLVKPRVWRRQHGDCLH